VERREKRHRQPSEQEERGNLLLSHQYRWSCSSPSCLALLLPSLTRLPFHLPLTPCVTPRSTPRGPALFKDSIPAAPLPSSNPTNPGSRGIREMKALFKGHCISVVLSGQLYFILFNLYRTLLHPPFFPFLYSTARYSTLQYCAKILPSPLTVINSSNLPFVRGTTIIHCSVRTRLYASQNGSSSSWSFCTCSSLA
jgi:hypothetical protein